IILPDPPQPFDQPGASCIMMEPEREEYASHTTRITSSTVVKPGRRLPKPIDRERFHPFVDGDGAQLLSRRAADNRLPEPRAGLLSSRCGRGAPGVRSLRKKK